MKILEEFKPSVSEQKVAAESFKALELLIEHLDTEETEIQIEVSNQKINIPTKALKQLSDILKTISQGKPTSVFPSATEVSTQKAADIIGCSRPYLVKLLEAGEIEFTKIGKHRRIKLEDIEKYKQLIKANRRQTIIDIMKSDEELGLYE